MTRPRTQRYRLTVEFELRDRGYYSFVRRLFYMAIDKIAEKWSGIQVDYIAIRKVTTKQIKRYNQP